MKILGDLRPGLGTDLFIGQVGEALERHRCMLPLRLSPQCPSGSWYCLTHGVTEWGGGGNIHRPSSYVACT